MTGEATARELTDHGASSSAELGPALVRRVHHGSTLEAELGDGRRVDADLALAFPYRPVRGDEVLVVGDGGRHYVIGVLSGRGPTRLSGPGLTVRTRRGRLRLSAAGDIALRSRQLELHADGELRIESRRATWLARELRQRVREKVDLFTGHADQVFDGAVVTQARRLVVALEGAFRFNGRTIRLG